MKKIIVLVAALGALAVPVAAGAQSTGSPHACSVEHRYLGSHGWLRGTAPSPGYESLKTTGYTSSSGACHQVALKSWLQITNVVFDDQAKGKGSFSVPGITGTWKHLKTVEVPNTCEGDGPGSSMSTPYGWFYLRANNLDGRLIGTGTVKLRLAC